MNEKNQTVSDIKITSNGIAGQNTVVEINGVPRHDLCSVKFDAEAASWVKVELGLIQQGSFEFEGKAIVSLSPETEALLRSLGWVRTYGDSGEDAT